MGGDGHRRPQTHGRLSPALHLGEDGGLSGSGSCNRYVVPYALIEETLSIGSAMTAEEAPLLDQEQRLFGILQEVQLFQIGAAGELEPIECTDRRVTAQRG